MKKLTSILLTAVLLATMLSVFAVPAFAATPGVTELTNPTPIEKTDKFTVTVEGENYGGFSIDDLDDIHYLYSGQSCEVTPNTTVRIHANYDPERYRISDYGEGWQPDDGCFIFVLTTGEAGGSTTITAPTLVRREYTVTVQGENYRGFTVTDREKDIDYELNPGQSCEITSGGDYQIHAYYDDTAYTFEDLGGWEITKGNISKIFKAGEAGESTTITAPTLVSKGYTGLGSVLSDGNIWIIVAVAVLALCGVAALIIVKKKKKSALADGESEGEE